MVCRAREVLLKAHGLLQQSAKSWGSFYAFALRLRFESQHVRTNRKVIANASARLTQTHTRRH